MVAPLIVSLSPAATFLRADRLPVPVVQAPSTLRAGTTSTGTHSRRVMAMRQSALRRQFWFQARTFLLAAFLTSPPRLPRPTSHFGTAVIGRTWEPALV